MENVAGILEVGLAEDGRHIAINRVGSKPDPNRSGRFELTPRHARYLANLLVEYATEVEAESAGTAPVVRRQNSTRAKTGAPRER